MNRLDDGLNPFPPDQYSSCIIVGLLFSYSLFLNAKYRKHGARAMLGRWEEVKLAQARREIRESGLVTSLATGQISGREHLKYFPLTTQLHFGTAYGASQKLQRAIDSMSYNCKWYLNRKGLCREHADLLPYLFFWGYMLLMMFVGPLLETAFGSWVDLPTFLLVPIGLVVMIYLRLRINAGAGCYELAFYDELAAATQHSPAPSQDAPAPHPAPAAMAQILDAPEHPAAP